MYAIADPEIAQNLDALERAEERMRTARDNQRWRDFLAAKRDVVPKLLTASEIVETSWFRLSAEQQDMIVNARQTLAEIIESQPRMGFGERFRAVAKSIWLLTHEQDAYRWCYAIVRFMVAVDRALASESRHFRMADEFIASNELAQADIARGEADLKAGRGSSYTLEEFQNRFESG